MAESTVVKDQLTDEMIEAGARLTEELDGLGLPIPTAMSFFMPENNEWRLFFGSPVVSTEGPLEVYRQIEKARKALGIQAGSIPLSAIGLLETNQQLARLLKSGLRTGPGVSRIRFSKNVINGHFIDDALIYRNTA